MLQLLNGATMLTAMPVTLGLRVGLGLRLIIGALAEIDVGDRAVVARAVRIHLVDAASRLLTPEQMFQVFDQPDPEDGTEPNSDRKMH